LIVPPGGFIIYWLAKGKPVRNIPTAETDVNLIGGEEGIDIGTPL